MVPYALGQSVSSSKIGPKLSEFNQDLFLKNNENKFKKKLKPVYKAIEITRKIR